MDNRLQTNNGIYDVWEFEEVGKIRNTIFDSALCLLKLTGMIQDTVLDSIL